MTSLSCCKFVYRPKRVNSRTIFYALGPSKRLPWCTIVPLVNSSLHAYSRVPENWELLDEMPFVCANPEHQSSATGTASQEWPMATWGMTIAVLDMHHSWMFVVKRPCFIFVPGTLDNCTQNRCNWKKLQRMPTQQLSLYATAGRHPVPTPHLMHGYSTFQSVLPLLNWWVNSD